MSDAPDPPAWFREALAAVPAERRIEVAGAPIRVLDWAGPAGAPGLVFIHGGAAHAHWWSFLAPMFTERWHPVAFDLSGHGDSGRRERYAHETWAEEAMAVAASAGFPGPPVVVGHSLGGLVAMQTAAAHGDLLAGAVIVDSPVRRPDPESEARARGTAFRSPGTYPDLDTALARYKLVPDQECENTFLVDHVARHSLHETPEGWTWKFDPTLFTHTMVSMREQLLSARCRLALFRGEDSVVVPPDTAAYMSELLGHRAPVVSIPGARHHLILDQPLAFVAALRTLLIDWGHT
ncbi:MAG: alpha/beta hydrolase [Actinobacteria bacterium]|nr:alpha/beta hydrolase [Actinomycetota bacterium]